MPPREITVFIASPGDLPDERRVFRDTIGILNAGFGDGANVCFTAVGWEDTLGTTGRRPQSVINAEIDACDVFVLVLNRRWGQEAPDAKPYASYTEEEFHRALNRFKKTASPEIFIFFKDVDPVSIAHPDPQLVKVLAFRRQLEDSRQVYYRSFSDETAFKQEIDRHLRAYAKGELPKPNAIREQVILPIEYVKRVEDAEAKSQQALSQAQRNMDQAAIATAKKAQLALTLARRAAQAALDGRVEEARQDFAQAIDDPAHPDTLLLAFQFYFRTGDLASAEYVIARILSLPIQDPILIGIAIHALGAIYQDRGENDKAERLYLQVLSMYEKRRDLVGVAAVYSDLGVLYATRGKLAKAEEVQLKGMAISQGLADPIGFAIQYANLGATYLARGELDKAEKMHRNALSLSEKVGYAQGIASAYSDLGVIASLRGDDENAEEGHRKALPIFEKLGDAKRTAIQYGALGVIYKNRSDLEKAEEMYRKSLAINQNAGYAIGIAGDLGNLAMVFEGRGELVKAEEISRKSLALEQKLGNQRGIASQYGNLAMICRSRGNSIRLKFGRRRQ